MTQSRLLPLRQGMAAELIDEIANPVVRDGEQGEHDVILPAPFRIHGFEYRQEDFELDDRQQDVLVAIVHAVISQSCDQTITERENCTQH